MTTDAKKPVTLRQVAEQAGVSAATASLVLNGKGDISEATRKRVLSAMRQMKYKPRTDRTRPDAVNTLRFLKIARHGHTVNRDHSHFIADYIDGMSYEATRRDYSLQVESFEGTEVDRIADTLRAGDVPAIRGGGTRTGGEQAPAANFQKNHYNAITRRLQGEFIYISYVYINLYIFI